jgi:hypothetical protein
MAVGPQAGPCGPACVSPAFLDKVETSRADYLDKAATRLNE